MMTNGAWLRFNHEFYQQRVALQGAQDRGAAEEVARAWAMRWATDSRIDVSGRPGYRKSWLSKVSALLGREEALRLLREAISA